MTVKCPKCETDNTGTAKFSTQVPQSFAVNALHLFRYLKIFL
jgi:phage FluMu protein Com